MTFRGRLVIAATVAVAIAVLLAAGGAFYFSRNALINSLDGQLANTAQSIIGPPNANPVIDGPQAYGDGLQIADASGSVVAGTGDKSLPVTAQVRAVAAGAAAPFFTSVTVGDDQYREYVSTIPGPFTIRAENSPPVLVQTSAALQLTTQLAATNDQLHKLGIALLLVALGGVVLAVILGWIVGRTALIPLNDLTDAVEQVAETTDVSRRLDPGGDDELGRLRRTFNHLLAALEASEDAQRQLVLDASHELRTPLTSLRTNLEVVRRVDELAPADREVLVTDVVTQMGELTKLVGDLAELARGEQRERVRAPFRLDQLVEDAVAVAATHGRTRDIRFDALIEPCWVEGLPERITRAVGNLLDNAIKWSPPGGVIEVYCQEGEVTVRDHGPGISPEDLPHIFARFYRARAARGLPGSGLGLSIVAQVAHDEGGTVEAQAAQGGGALLRLRFPVVAAPDVELVDD